MTGVCEGECMNECMDEPPHLTRCNSYGMPKLYEAVEGWKSVCAQAYNLKGIKGKVLFFFSFLSFVSLLL